MSIGFTLPLQRGDGGYFEVSNDLLTQIKSNFINLVSTMKGERLGNPTFGCDIHNVIFNMNTDELGGFTGQHRGSEHGRLKQSTGPWQSARETIESAVAAEMPYIELEKFEIETIDADKERYTARIYMSYRLTEQPSLTGEVLIQI